MIDQRPGNYALPEPPPLVPKFIFPDDYGGWWTFEICMVAGLIAVLTADRWSVSALCLAGGMQALFLASEWLTGLGRREHRENWKNWRGLSLCLGGAILLGMGVYLAPGLKAPLALILLFWGLLAGGVLWMRIVLFPRNMRLLMAASVLLTGPALILGVLAFGASDFRALGLWGLWAWFFPWDIFYVQTWIRGNTEPTWRIVLASVSFFLEAAVLAIFSSRLAAVLLLLLCIRVALRLKHRLVEIKHSDGKPHMATSPWELRLLAYEQMAWCLALCGIWFVG